MSDVWILLLCGTDPHDSHGLGFLTSMVAGIDAEAASRSLLEKLRRAAGAGQSKATLVTLPEGSGGGGLIEAKPLEVVSAMKLFLNKCLDS